VGQHRQLLRQRRHLAGPRAGLGQDRPPAHVAGVLPEVAQGQLPRPLDVAVVGLLLADQQPEQRALAGAVGPHQPDLLARVDLERRLDEQHLSAVLLADVRERDHDGGM
jgi:hypothetical protein